GGRTVPGLATAVILPNEQDTGPVADPPTAIDDSASIDRLRVFNARSRSNDTGTLTGTNLSGLNMAGDLTLDEGTARQPMRVVVPGGISYTLVEILEVLLGSGNDNFTIKGTLTADGIQNPTAPLGQRGGLTVVQGGGGNDTITVNGGGGPTSPLVIFGDTAQ